jgi:hypothetical protein
LGQLEVDFKMEVDFGGGFLKPLKTDSDFGVKFQCGGGFNMEAD